MSPTIRQYRVTVSVTPGAIQRRFAAQLGIDCEAFEFRTRTVAPGEPIHVVTVGRMIERKGHRYVIEAVSTLRTRRRDLDVRLDVVGSGPLFAEIRTLVANLRLGPAVTLHGGLANGEIRELLERSHIFALHCVTGRGGDVEGLPVSMMEAMAMGLPVVSTRHGGIPGLVADGASGFLVAERDVEGTAAAIARLADDPGLLQQMGREGRAIVERSYNTERQAHRLHALLTSLTNSRGVKVD